MRRIGVGDLRLTERHKANVMDALNQNRLTYGKWQEEFEARFASVHGKKYACFVNSGTDALRLGLIAMKEHYGWPDGARVKVPAVTFVATFNIVIQSGLTPVLCDVNLDDYGIEPMGATEDCVAIIPAHLFGHVAPKRWNAHVPVLSDSCETMFMPGCAEGAVSAFSTYTAHLITTGVGGLALTDDPSLARIVRSLANHGRSGIYTGIDDPLGKPEIMSARFNFERLGYSSRGTEVQAAIGCAELDEWPRNIARRQTNAEALRDGLRDLPLFLPRWPASESAWMMFPVRTENRIQRDMLITYLEMNGIETRPLLPLTNQPYIRDMYPAVDLAAHFPNAHTINETGFYVGCHQYLGPEDIEYMVSVFRKFFA